MLPFILQKSLLTIKKILCIIFLFIKYGGVAQLGERLTGSQEVMGSIPTVSTKESAGKSCRFFIFVTISFSA